MREIKYIAVHCTAGSQKQTVGSLLHFFSKVKKWKSPGYHYVVEANGKITQLLDEERVSNGVKGFNSITINVAWFGGIDERGKAVDNRTNEQKRALAQLVGILKKKYLGAIVQGHRDFSPDKNGNGKVDVWERIKECPCFDAKEEYESL